ncbi:MAG: heme biosynthesis protein HemY [Rhodospirillaceae bacterium]|jgi:HemY protein|nr:heme biosynthesis protein HemY [Rhodospirillaceae bacterium]MBT3887305.1 heme biosynthesis protein HemY [Rhodospirillaceae bacterium]MBT4116511.1 heme biosynthesis protein HemY [Rhodospirillaceae bacterium]MBT4670844.1 heme biosynthesis protein HemY [Rhodospirillaceae bacterium]MBT4748145.1 heme biosynthesis protein HemY [Rhodospirillaceae bacterium]
MIRALWFFILLAGFSYLAARLADNPGAVSMDWLGYHVETTAGLLVTGLVIVALLLATVFRIWSYFRRAPKRVVRARREWRRRRGYKALTQGMVAVAAGDAQEARRQARKADNLLAEPPLTMLLSAQAAQLSGDDEAAGKFFEAMAEKPETEYLGLSGMLNQRLQDGDTEAAMELAEKASDLKPKTDTVNATLLDLQIKNADWEAAEDTVRKSIRAKLTDADSGRRRRGVLNYQRSIEAEAEGRLGDALQMAQRANGLAPSFVPAALRTARLLADAGKRRKAVSIIEEAWVRNPHTGLARLMEELAPGGTPSDKLHAIEKLAGNNKDHVESHLSVAQAALAAELWTEAREHLAAVQTENPPGRFCRMMAELEEGENPNSEAAREWLKRAAMGDPDPAWICDSCGNVVAEWEPVCGRCEAFDTFAWNTPPRVTRMEDTGDRTPDPADAPLVPDTKPGDI